MPEKGKGFRKHYHLALGVLEKHTGKRDSICSRRGTGDFCLRRRADPVAAEASVMESQGCKSKY